TFSPYHLLHDGVEYPETFIWTATSDDRVGPVQARKMAPRMQERGIPIVCSMKHSKAGMPAPRTTGRQPHCKPEATTSCGVCWPGATEVPFRWPAACKAVRTARPAASP